VHLISSHSYRNRDDTCKKQVLLWHINYFASEQHDYWYTK